MLLYPSPQESLARTLAELQATQAAAAARDAAAERGEDDPEQGTTPG